MNQRLERKHLSATERFVALSRVGTALMREFDETRLLYLIAQTACDLTGAQFAAFSIRPINEEGAPLVPSEGQFFHLAAVVGVTSEQEALFRHMPLGGEGLLAPIFRYGVPVLVADALTHLASTEHLQPAEAREMAEAYAQGLVAAEELRSLGVPPGHPVVRSFLGAPLLDRDGQVCGGMLLGHPEPGQFTSEDEALLVGLAAQAAVALENARLYRTTQMHVQELATIFEGIADGVILVDRHGTILRENAAAGRVRETLKNLPSGEQVAEALLYAPARRALGGEVVLGSTVRVGNGDVETREYLVTASPLRPPRAPGSPLVSKPLVLSEAKDQPLSEQRVSGAVLVWHDVTEQRIREAEREARERREARLALLQAILDELPSSVYLVRGHDARLVIANQAAAGVWGATWAYDQPMSQFLTEHGIRIFGVDGRPLALSQLATIRAIQKGETVRHYQEVIRRPDRATLPVLVNAVALDSRKLNLAPEDGVDHRAGAIEPVALVVHQDVSALKEAEYLKDEFIGIAAHELRNPLAVLKGFAQTLLYQTERGRGSALADWQKEALEEIDQATTRLDKLTEDLLDVARLQAGRLRLSHKPTDLVALARRMVAQRQMTTKQHLLSVHTELPFLVVFVDHERIEQVLSNLLSNAIKYSPQGGPIEVTIWEEVKADVAGLSIRDRGMGIPAQQQARIFGRFVRAENARAAEITGTGLGLYICRELVERHGGRLWFESTEGVGSTFFMTLPKRGERPWSSDLGVDSPPP